jgi:hypothetical protein
VHESAVHNIRSGGNQLGQRVVRMGDESNFVTQVKVKWIAVMAIMSDPDFAVRGPVF